MTETELKTATKKQLLEFMAHCYPATMQVYRDMPVERLRQCALRELSMQEAP